MYNWWKSGKPDIIIRMADGKDINFLFKHGLNNIPIGPTERAVFIKSGRMLGIIDQDTIRIAQEWSGEKVKGLERGKVIEDEEFKPYFYELTEEERGLREYRFEDCIEIIKKRVVSGHINVLLVDATTIDMAFPLEPSDGIYTADRRDRIIGKFVLRFEFDPLEATKQMKLLSRSKVMTVQGLRDRLRDEVISEVIKPVLSEFSSDVIYGNRDVREKAEMSVLHEMKKTLSNWGLDIQKVIFNPDTPGRIEMESELANRKAQLAGDMKIREMEREDEAKAVEHILNIETETRERQALQEQNTQRERLETAKEVLDILESRRKGREERLHRRKRESKELEHGMEIEKKVIDHNHLTDLKKASDATIDALLKKALETGDTEMVKQLHAIVREKSIQLAVAGGRSGDSGVGRVAFKSAGERKGTGKEGAVKTAMEREFKELKRMRDMGMLKKREFESRRKKLLRKYGY